MTSSTGSPPTLDPQIVGQIRKLGQGRGADLLRKIVNQYADSSANLIEEIAAGVGKADAEAVAVSSHGLASSSATLGAMALLELARSLEMEAKAGNLNRGQLQLEAIEAEWALVVPALREALLGE